MQQLKGLPLEPTFLDKTRTALGAPLHCRSALNYHFYLGSFFYLGFALKFVISCTNLHILGLIYLPFLSSS